MWFSLAAFDASKSTISSYSFWFLFSSPSNLRSINAGGQCSLRVTVTGRIVMRQRIRTIFEREERLYALLTLWYTNQRW